MESPIIPSDYFVTLTIRVKPAFLSRMRVIMHDLVIMSRKENGCVLYLAAESQDTSALFLITSVWKDRESYEAHRSSPYFRAFESQIGQEVIRGSVTKRTWHKIG